MDNETGLVIATFIFVGVMSLLILAKAPNLGVVNKNVEFSKAKMPQYIKFLVGVAVASIGIGYLMTTKHVVVLQYVGLNLFIGAILGANLFLYRYKKGS